MSRRRGTPPRVARRPPIAPLLDACPRFDPTGLSRKAPAEDIANEIADHLASAFACGESAEITHAMSAVERLLEQREHEEFVVLYFLENFQNLLTWHVGLDALARLRAFLGARTVAQWELLTAYWEDVRAWTAENPEGGAPTVAQLRGVKDEQVRLLVWSSARVFANEELVFVHDVVRYQIATGRLLGEPPLR